MRCQSKLVSEMRELTREVADYVETSPKWYPRVSSVSEALDFGFSRTYDLYFGKARRVDPEDIAHARQIARELKFKWEAEETARCIAATIEHLRETGQDPNRYLIHALKRVLDQTGLQSSPVSED